MITMLLIFCLLLVIAFIVAVIMGFVAVSPLALLIIIMVAVDYFVIKAIFGKKK